MNRALTQHKLNAMSYSITSSLIAASSHINTMTVIPFMHVNAAL